MLYDFGEQAKKLEKMAEERRKSETMTSYERIKTAFELGIPDRVPVTPFVRECCLQWIGKKFIDGLFNPELYAFAQLHAVFKLGYDMVLDLTAVHAESEAMGSILKIRDEYPPSVEVPVIQDYKKDLPRLRILDPYEEKTPHGTPSRLPMILKIIQIEKAVCKEYGIPVMGYVQAPTRHAAMLRGTEKLYLDFRRDVKHALELLEIATESLKIWGRAVISAGADIIWVSDPVSSGSAISRADFEKFSYPFVTQLIEFLKRCNPDVKIFYHICGDVNDRIDLMARTGADGLSVDHTVDIVKAKETAHKFGVCIMGNVDPVNVMMFGTPEDVRRECKKLIESVGKDGGFILASGCILPNVPYENVKAMVDEAKLSSRY